MLSDLTLRVLNSIGASSSKRKWTEVTFVHFFLFFLKNFRSFIQSTDLFYGSVSHSSVTHEKSHVSLLVLLDLSAAFDAIDHGILLERLGSAFEVRDMALSWIASYLSGRTRQVSIDGILSMKLDLECSVPQGSCLGPLLFVVYPSKIFEIVDKHSLEIHCYADNSQLYLSFCRNNIANSLHVAVPFPRGKTGGRECLRKADTNRVM